MHVWRLTAKALLFNTKLMQVMKKFAFLLVVITTLTLFSCTKREQQEELSQEDESLDMIDGVSQAENIVPINLNVQIIDGIMTFNNHEELVSTMDLLANYNIESIVAWEMKVGFKSLFSEYMRIEELPKSEISEELKQGRLAQILEFQEDILLMPLYNLYSSRVHNTDGLVRVGDFVGTIGSQLNVWVKAENTSLLLEALNTGSISSNDKLIVYDDSIYDIESRDWILDAQCPRDVGINRGFIKFKNPDANRRLNAMETLIIL